MRISNRTILVTGGASGIGLALAKRFQQAGSQVIICGRRQDKLDEARAANPAFQTHVADVGTSAGRKALAEWAVTAFPALDVLVNNAGIQRHVPPVADESWDDTHHEIAINLEAPIHLSRLLLPHLKKQPQAAIVNVTSGLSFSPVSRVAVYCATKAALHSFTLSLRHQLKDSTVEVVEIIPPAVDTDLGGPGLHTFGVNVDVFADDVMAKIQEGAVEAAHGMSEQASRASRAELDAIFANMNR